MPLTLRDADASASRVDAGRPVCHVAAETGIARQTLAKWYAGWLLDGEDGLHDRSSRPESSRARTDPRVEAYVRTYRRTK